MSKTTINLRIDDKIKTNAENVLEELGLSMTSAITLFLKAVSRTKSIPFPITTNNPKKANTQNNRPKTVFENEDLDLDFDIDQLDSLKNAIDNL